MSDHETGAAEGKRLLLDLLLGLDLAMKLRDDMDLKLTSHFYSVAAILIRCSLLLL